MLGIAYGLNMWLTYIYCVSIMQVQEEKQPAHDGIKRNGLGNSKSDICFKEIA